METASMNSLWSSAVWIDSVILTVLAILVIVIFLGSIYSFVVAVFQFIFSNGDAEKIKTARNNIRFMIIGILLTMVLLFAFPLAFQYLKIQGYKTYTASNIFNRAGEIINQLINKSTSIIKLQSWASTSNSLDSSPSSAERLEL